MNNRSYNRPERIDIYVDGTWLHAGKHNTVEVGSWAGVIVETYAGNRQETWIPSDVVSQGESNEAEIQAVFGGLRAVHIREQYRAGDGKFPEVTVHTDSPHLIHRIITQPAHHPQGNELVELLKRTGAQVMYGSHDKTGTDNKPAAHPEMGEAHQEGRRVAWTERAKRQGGKFHTYTSGWLHYNNG